MARFDWLLLPGPSSLGQGWDQGSSFPVTGAGDDEAVLGAGCAAAPVVCCCVRVELRVRGPGWGRGEGGRTGHSY